MNLPLQIWFVSLPSGIERREAMRDYLSEIKNMSLKEMNTLSGELREKIITAVSKNGGHLASNLGMVEATVALHHVFDSPNDKLIFDVGHQCYAHKILTGREEGIDTLRTFGGISGFPSRKESEHDILNEGHSGTSISSALGIAEANKLAGNDNYAVAIIGDGSLTNGMVYEALNNCAKKDLRLIILINDNEMSISKNVGALPRYLSKIRVSRGYFRLKRGAKRGLGILPLLGKPFIKLFAMIKNAFRRVFVKNTMFEDLGIEYLGPVDGHNIKKLIMVLNEAKTRKECVVVHIKTKKGQGYTYAENEPSKYHGIGKFDPQNGVNPSNSETFSTYAGSTLTKLAKEDEKICAITAAMCDGTGLTPFAEQIPDRFFDVGIAEEHAITFGAGLSVSGMKPVVALYSTFAQRVYDQALHDIAIQGLPMTLLLDRCGLVAGDGITHQGIFDYALFSSVPNVKIYSPRCYDEVGKSLKIALSDNDFDIIRYPKGSEKSYTPCHKMVYDEENLYYYSENIDKAKRVIITYGRITSLANEVLVEMGDTALIQLVRIFPLDFEKICKLCSGKELVYILEEGYIHGGVGEKLATHLVGAVSKVHIHAIEGLVEHGELDDLNKLCGFTKEQIVENINNLT